MNQFNKKIHAGNMMQTLYLMLPKKSRGAFEGREVGECGLNHSPKLPSKSGSGIVHLGTARKLCHKFQMNTIVLFNDFDGQRGAVPNAKQKPRLYT